MIVWNTYVYVCSYFTESQKSEIDITRAVKVPPMPGQSRSLLQFNPTIKEEFNVNDNAKVAAVNIKTEAAEVDTMSSPFHDHDYFMVGQFGQDAEPRSKRQKLSPYIEADVPPQGYGYDTKDGLLLDTSKEDVFVVLEDEDESQLNVNVTGSGPTRTVVLHVPKDMKWTWRRSSLNWWPQWVLRMKCLNSNNSFLPFWTYRFWPFIESAICKGLHL